MKPKDELYYLNHHEIDETKWDECIDNATNGIIYAKSYYLDKICTNWGAIILNNYEAVLPLPWKRKYGITYVYPPAFMQQLGLFAVRKTDAVLLSKMIAVAESKFQFGEYFLNFGNHHKSTVAKTNFILLLNTEYDTIVKNYKQDLIKNLKKVKQYSLQYVQTNDYGNAIRLYQSTYGDRTPHVIKEDYTRIANACKVLSQKKELIVREVKDADENLLACALCLKDKKRIYLLLSTTTAAGRHMEANHFMIDRLIHEFSNQDITLDFEGSDLPGIAHFYKNFGSINQPYFFYRWNHLPWPLNLLKGK